MNIVVVPVTGHLDHLITAQSYGVLRPGRGKINVCLRNHSAKQITLPKWTGVRQITAANVIPSLSAPKPIEDESDRGEATAQKGKSESQEEPLKKIDLTGLWDWSLDEQKEAWELIVEYVSIFAMRDMDLDKTSLVKLRFRLIDNTPLILY